MIEFLFVLLVSVVPGVAVVLTRRRALRIAVSCSFGLWFAVAATTFSRLEATCTDAPCVPVHDALWTFGWPGSLALLLPTSIAALVDGLAGVHRRREYWKTIERER